MGALQGRAKPKPFTRVQEYLRNKRNERKEKKKLKKEIKALRLKAKHSNVEEQIEEAFPTPKDASLGLTSKPDFELASLWLTLAEPESKEVKNDCTEDFIKSSRPGHQAGEVTEECTQDDIGVEIPTLEDGQTVDLQVALEELRVADEEDVTAESHEQLISVEELKEESVKYVDPALSNLPTKLDDQEKIVVVSLKLNIQEHLNTLQVINGNTQASSSITERARENKAPKSQPVTSVSDDKEETPKIEASQSEYTFSQHTSLESTSLDVLSDEVEEPHVFEDPEMYPGREIISDYERYIPSVDWPHRPPSLSVTIDSGWSGYSSYCGHYDSSDTEYITSCTPSYDDDVFYDEEIVTGVQKMSPRYERTGKSDAESIAEKRQPAPERPLHARKISITSEKYSARKTYQGPTKVSRCHAEISNVPLVDANIVVNNGSNLARKRVAEKQTSTKQMTVPDSGFNPKDSSMARKAQVVSMKRLSTIKLMVCQDTPTAVPMKNSLECKKSATAAKLLKSKVQKTIQLADRSRQNRQTASKRQELKIVETKKPSSNRIKPKVQSHKRTISEVVKLKPAAFSYRHINAPLSSSEGKLSQSKRVNSITKAVKVSPLRLPSCKGANISNPGGSNLMKWTETAASSHYSSSQPRGTTSLGDAPVMFPQREQSSSARKSKLKPPVSGHSVKDPKLPAIRESLQKSELSRTPLSHHKGKCTNPKSSKVILQKELKMAAVPNKRIKQNILSHSNKKRELSEES